MSRKYLIIGMACLSLTACHQPTERETAWVRPVKTALATGENVVNKKYAGMVEAAQYVTLSFPISGRIEQLPINEGRIGMSDVLSAQLSWTTARSNLIQALLAQKLAMAEYRMVTNQ